MTCRAHMCVYVIFWWAAKSNSIATDGNRVSSFRSSLWQNIHIIDKFPCHTLAQHKIAYTWAYVTHINIRTEKVCILAQYSVSMHMCGMASTGCVRVLVHGLVIVVVHSTHIRMWNCVCAFCSNQTNGIKQRKKRSHKSLFCTFELRERTRIYIQSEAVSL